MKAYIKLNPKYTQRQNISTLPITPHHPQKAWTSNKTINVVMAVVPIISAILFVEHKKSPAN